MAMSGPMTMPTIDTRWIGHIAAGSFDTGGLEVAEARALIRHNLALAAAALIPVRKTDPTPAERLLLDERKRRVMQMMRVVGAFSHVSRLLADAKVAHLLIKGPALAVQTTGSWSGRNSCDVDLLIDPADYPEAHRAFVAGGLGRRDGRPGPAGRFFQWATCEIGYHGTFANIDLHWRLDASPALYDVSFARLSEGAEEVSIDGTMVSTLGRLDAWLFTAVHGARSDWMRWSMLLDAVRQADRLSAAERAEARVLAKQRGCGASLAVAEALVARCRADEAATGPEEWAMKRADRILADTSAGEAARLGFAASFSRRAELARSNPGPGAAIGSFGRALGRILLNPGHYKGHLLTSLGFIGK